MVSIGRRVLSTWPQTLVHPRTFGGVDLHPVQETRTDKGTTITVCDVRLLLSTPYNIVAHRAIGTPTKRLHPCSRHARTLRIPLIAARQPTPANSTQMPANRPRAKHDEAYKLLFSSAAMVEGFLVHMLPEFSQLVDPSTLQQLSPSFVKPDALRQRHVRLSRRLVQPGASPLSVLTRSAYPLAGDFSPGSFRSSYRPLSTMERAPGKRFWIPAMGVSFAGFAHSDSRYRPGCGSPMRSSVKPVPGRGGRR